MSCSPARSAANLANAQKSTGPRTEEGKAVSRGNALKHGLTGEGVALPTEDVAAVAQRFEALREEFRPSGAMAGVLVQRIALLSVRLERSVKQDTAALSMRVLRAEDDFVEARKAEADHLLNWIGNEPATHARRLRATPEGVDCLISEWQLMKADLEHTNGCKWDYPHYMKADAMNGRGSGNIALSPYQALTFAMRGKFHHLVEHEGAGLDDQARMAWAKRQIGVLIDAEVATLQEHRATLDWDGIAAQKAYAADLALFDPSKEATLARKYEAATERAMYRAIKELRTLQPSPDQAKPAAEAPASDPASPALGSFIPTGPGVDRQPKPASIDTPPFPEQPPYFAPVGPPRKSPEPVDHRNRPSEG